MNEQISQVIVFVLVGFFAQLIDGSLGMGYKVSSTSFLLSFGIPPVLASASVHSAGVFTSISSALAHIKFGNVKPDLVKKLIVPGVIGGILGALVLTSIPADLIKPAVALYLLIMGVIIVYKALREASIIPAASRIVPLAFAGGFFDAIGGGGWGPIVTSTLVARGGEPRFVIGSVNTAEFFVTLLQAITFFTVLGQVHVTAVIGLIIGGVVAAPAAAYISKNLAAKRLMLLVGLLIITLSVRTFYLAITG
ncbi:MAG: sulfite exporter TauE/SafE family protein [Anaerolineae bacterium]|nr:sulfite exporter TauE/SafE family protein [Anaerolineae bacterium]